MNELKMICLSLLVTGIVLTACSENDKPLTRVMPQGEDVVLDADTLQVFEGITVKFQMLNADTLPVTTFKEGEDITFRLVVTNSRDEEVAIPASLALIGGDAFHIYTAQGEDIGRPWDSRIPFGLGTLIPRPGQSYQFLCPAFGEKEEEPDITHYFPGADPWGSWVLFYKSDYARNPLPKGSYYTEFEINLNNGSENPSLGYKGVLCRKDFRIE